jgi:hypothetical protein
MEAAESTGFQAVESVLAESFSVAGFPFSQAVKKEQLRIITIDFS